MVRVFRFLLLAAAVFFLSLKISAKDWSNYQIGDTLEQDVVAPTPLTVVDLDATQALKQKEAQRVPAIIRFNTNAADEVTARFRQNFVKTRSDFLSTVEGAFHHQVLSADELTSVKFSSLAILFQRQNKLFPLNPNRAALWATGDADQAYEESLAAVLRRTMSAPIRPEAWPLESTPGATVRLVALASANETLTASVAEHTGVNMPRTNLLALSAAKKDVQNMFLSDERPVGRYLSSLLRPNCALDENITLMLREKQTEGMWAADHYNAGQVIARRGQIVDVKIKAALDQMKDKAALGQLQTVLVQNQVKAVQEQKQTRWVVSALAGAVLVLCLAIWQLARRKPAVSLLPATVESSGLTRSSVEQRQLHNGLMRWLTDKFTQKLLAQRSELINTQQTAAIEIADLEARLEKIHAPLQDRLTTYERRIAELEKELALKGEENRELIKAKIEVIQQQLELERSGNRLEFN